MLRLFFENALPYLFSLGWFNDANYRFAQQYIYYLNW